MLSKGISHANQRFAEAVHALAIGRGRIDERLTNAFGHHLAHIQPDQDLPAGKLRDDFLSLVDLITAREPALQGEGAILARIRSLGEDEAVKIAERILQLAVLIELAYEEGLEP